jgi:hypothetical protein
METKLGKISDKPVIKQIIDLIPVNLLKRRVYSWKNTSIRVTKTEKDKGHFVCAELLIGTKRTISKNKSPAVMQMSLF